MAASFISGKGNTGVAAASFGFETISLSSDFDDDLIMIAEASKVVPQEPFPATPWEINTTEKQSSRRRQIHAFFRRTWRSVKKPFICCTQTSVQSQTLLLNPHLEPEPVIARTAMKTFVCFKQIRVELQRSLENPHPAIPEPVPGLQNTADGSEYEPNCGSMSNFYKVESLLGCGSFGEVYKAVRISDGKEVAIKNIRKRIADQYLSFANILHKEVMFMLTLRRPPVSPNVIEMYEWFDQPEVISLVMEYPGPCENLWEYTSSSGKISERVAHGLMRQLVLAVRHCIELGVFHNDIHPNNILVNTRTLELKLIDFGCAHSVKTEGYNSDYYAGAFLFCPPDVFGNSKYHAVPTNVWALGIVLYYMVKGDLPFYNLEEILDADPQYMHGISVECIDLIYKCLHRTPEQRPTLEQILQHEWLIKTAQIFQGHMQSLQQQREIHI